MKIKRRVMLTTVIIFISFCGVSASVIFLTADALFLKHKNAIRTWDDRKPAHYRYTLILEGKLVYRTFGIEVIHGKLASLTDMHTGMSTSMLNKASSSFLPTNEWVNRNLLIDDLFWQIKTATRMPYSAEAFLVRTNARLHYQLVQNGWLTNRTPTCLPAFPKVNYHPIYGFPENLELAEKPCVHGDASLPVSLRIEEFQPLP